MASPEHLTIDPCTCRVRRLGQHSPTCPQWVYVPPTSFDPRMLERALEEIAAGCNNPMDVAGDALAAYGLHTCEEAPECIPCDMMGRPK